MREAASNACLLHPELIRQQEVLQVYAQLMYAFNAWHVAVRALLAAS